jgi:hypothetical protein
VLGQLAQPSTEIDPLNDRGSDEVSTSATRVSGWPAAQFGLAEVPVLGAMDIFSIFPVRVPSATIPAAIIPSAVVPAATTPVDLDPLRASLRFRPDWEITKEELAANSLKLLQLPAASPGTSESTFQLPFVEIGATSTRPARSTTTRNKIGSRTRAM